MVEPLRHFKTRKLGHVMCWSMSRRDMLRSFQKCAAFWAPLTIHNRLLDGAMARPGSRSKDQKRFKKLRFFAQPFQWDLPLQFWSDKLGYEMAFHETYTNFHSFPSLFLLPIITKYRRPRRARAPGASRVPGLYTIHNAMLDGCLARPGNIWLRKKINLNCWFSSPKPKPLWNALTLKWCSCYSLKEPWPLLSYH